MTEKNGDIPANSIEGLGLYTKDTRFLSQLEVKINGLKPVLLASAADENYISTIRMTNSHMEENGEIILWRESIELQRTRFIYEGALYETVKLTNYFPKAITFDFSIALDADFTDMFIVRGFKYDKMGEVVERVLGDKAKEIHYVGSDQVNRATKIKWNVSANSIDETGELHFNVELNHGEHKEITFWIAPCIEGDEPKQFDFHEAMTNLKASYSEWNVESASIKSDLPLFDRLYDRGVQDLRVLLTDLGYGKFPVAGLPWFSVPFGRDSLIAALQMLSVNPSIAKGTLLTLAAYQGSNLDSWRDEEPGKIMHEIRSGELANTNQVPFTPYYGTIDATPLFLMLAAEYAQWTGDYLLIEQLMPHLEGAINWIMTYGDCDGDHFVEYAQKSSKGIANQGWKDSADSIIHRNGEYAEAPIALVEVQGYVYQSFVRLAPILRNLKLDDRAAQLEQYAQHLQLKFEESFWIEDEQFYAIALDGHKQQVNSITSNAGHLLMSGMIAEERAKLVAQRLVQADMFSGYGIRTMSSQSAGYNPMSYHDGSIWPHDNSLTILGLSQLGFHEEAGKVIQGLLQAAEKFEYYRLPELFCGYDHSLGSPVPYPVACSPQAWAAGTPLTFVRAMLGISPDNVAGVIKLSPFLLSEMNELIVERLQVGKGKISLRLFREQDLVKVEILSNDTGLAIIVE